jgi:hypothetical protein
MRTGITVILATAVAATAACGGGKPPAPAEQASAPSPQAPAGDAAAGSDELGQAIRSVLDADWEARYFDANVDLNGDGTPEAIAYIAGPMVCGTGGCPLFVFAAGPDGYRLVSRLSVVQLPVRLAPRSSNGWRNLVVGIGGGGLAAGNAELKFDGKTYPANPTVPPAEPMTDLAGSEVLIPEFESYTEGKSVPAQVYGDAKLPLAGEVLGTAIHTQDAEELRYYVLRKLTDRYAAEKGIGVTEAEKAAYIEHLREVLSKDPNFPGPVPGTEESAEDKAAREEIAAAFIRQWKINRALHEQYGGRIIFQQGGPEPLDAYRKFLEESAARGDFEIVNKGLETDFWRYYRDESIHDFFKPGSAEEAKAFADPPWLAD